MLIMGLLFLCVEKSLESLSGVLAGLNRLRSTKVDAAEIAGLAGGHCCLQDFLYISQCQGSFLAGVIAG